MSDDKMKFKRFTPEARRLIVELGITPESGLSDDLKQRLERSWYIAKADGSDVITAEHLRAALDEGLADGSS